MLLLACATSCYNMRSSKGGGEVSNNVRKINPSDIALPPGYRVTVAARGLTFPSAIAFDESGNLYVIETGYSYGEVWLEPKLLRIATDGTTSVIAKGERNGPWTGIVYHDGSFYVSEGGAAESGRILRISRTGQIVALVEDLPSTGDHHTNALAVHNGYIYFGQGTATNSAVVGEDNASFGWLRRMPAVHDIPCGTITLRGVNYTTDNVLTDDPGDKAVTGAYSPFGKETTRGQTIPGKVPCNGAVMRIPLTGGQPELVAWGLRNPYAIAASPEGKLFVTDNAYDERGSRPVWGAADVLWELKEGAWYGWPDFSAGQPIWNDEEYQSPDAHGVKRLLEKHPAIPPQPAAVFAVHSSSDGIDFSTSPSFGYEGEAFVAQFGDMAPGVGKVLSPVGFKVVRVDVKTGVVRDFAVNKGKRNGPATWLGRGGLERPVSVKFSNNGEALYVADFGVLLMTDKGPKPEQNTGVIWKITRR